MIIFLFVLLFSLASQGLAETPTAQAEQATDITPQISDFFLRNRKHKNEVPIGQSTRVKVFDEHIPQKNGGAHENQGWHIIVSTQNSTSTQQKKIKFKTLRRGPCESITPIEKYHGLSGCALHSLKTLSKDDGETGASFLSLFAEGNTSDTAFETNKAAVILLALGGHISRAHLLSKQSEDLKNIFWYILSEVGSIQDLFRYAANEDQESILSIPIRTKKRVIDRLLRSPAPNIAEKWIEGSASAGMKTRYVKLKISGNDYHNLETDNTATGYLLSLAYQGAGDIERSSSWFHVRDFSPELHYSEKLQGMAKPEDPTAWGDLSRKIENPADISQMPPLKASRALVENSEATRQSLVDLIAEVTNPKEVDSSRFEFSD